MIGALTYDANTYELKVTVVDNLGGTSDSGTLALRLPFHTGAFLDIGKGRVICRRLLRRRQLS